MSSSNHFHSHTHFSELNDVPSYEINQPFTCTVSCARVWVTRADVPMGIMWCDTTKRRSTRPSERVRNNVDVGAEIVWHQRRTCTLTCTVHHANTLINNLKPVSPSVSLTTPLSHRRRSRKRVGHWWSRGQQCVAWRADESWGVARSQGRRAQVGQGGGSWVWDLRPAHITSR
jgi:hypothetical protein